MPRVQGLSVGVAFFFYVKPADLLKDEPLVYMAFLRSYMKTHFMKGGMQDEDKLS